ncbi:amino acid transporter AVT6C [Elaeis guineensis]|uniref:Amino acid transporter AVT6C n=1 Tax=Elaeis guineensis var. tenera TaxID=51953 RepID=A0A6I9RSB9_ELAGV|nr:amino acid transporter AVT6C [Elaeis guineensis]
MVIRTGASPAPMPPEKSVQMNSAGKENSMLAPLLPEVRQPAAEQMGGASVSGAVFNISTTIIGAGIMSLPAATKVLGVGPALLLIAAVAFLSNVSSEFLLRYTVPGSPCSYAGVMGESFGQVGSTAVQLCVVLATMGTLTVFLIIIGDVLSGNRSEGTVHVGVLQEWFGEQWWNERDVALLITLVVIILPLILLRRVDSLRLTSAISVLLAVVFMCLSSGMALYALFHGTAQTPRLLPDFAHLSNAFELFTAVPVIVVAFTFHFNVHPIQAEVSNYSNMKVAVRISLLLCAAIYAVVGFFGYLLFGELTMADVLSNFDQNSGSQIGRLLNDIVRLSYALHLILVFPLLNFALRLNIDELLFSRSKPLAEDTIRFVSLTSLLMGLIYLTAVAIPSVWTMFQFIGSTAAVCLSLIFPGAIVLRDIHGIANRKDKVQAASMIALAVITSSIAIASNVISYIGSGESNEDQA